MPPFLQLLNDLYAAQMAHKPRPVAIHNKRADAELKHAHKLTRTYRRKQALKKLHKRQRVGNYRSHR